MIASSRRKDDDTIIHVHECVEGMKTRVLALEAQVASVQKDVAENTEVTKEVREILASFRILGTAAKWFTGIATAATAAIALVRSLKGG